MTATIIWSVSKMDCHAQIGEATNVVFNVDWVCTGMQDTAVVSVFNTCAVPLVEDGPFTAYDDLTNEQVLGWIWANGVDRAAVEATVQQQITDQINPPVVSPPLPWISPAA